jgi:hypothetical protein
VTIGDWDGDRRGDLWVLGDEGAVSVFSGSDFETSLADLELAGSPTAIAIGDRDGDGEVEIFSTGSGAGVVISDRMGEAIDSATLGGVEVIALGAADEDGDGRSDISRLSSDGVLHVAVGNSTTGRSVDGWWRDPGYQCQDDTVPLTWGGTFYDDDTSVFEGDIERVAQLGITRGCNPPFGDAYCPTDPISRGQMAAFLVRALSLPPAGRDAFVDDDGSEFEDDIDRLAAAGVTTGCSDAGFCPDALVSRGEMAAFINRGFELDARFEIEVENQFSDDDQSVFERDIELLAAAGITRGCDPPANGRYCPDAPVSRGEMAAFLGRATQIG